MYLVSGPFSLSAKQVCLEGSMDAFVLIDALEVVMGHEEKELCKPGQATLALMLQTATTILGSKDRVTNIYITGYFESKLFFKTAWISYPSEHLAAHKIFYTVFL